VRRLKQKFLNVAFVEVASSHFFAASCPHVSVPLFRLHASHVFQDGSSLLDVALLCDGLDTDRKSPLIIALAIKQEFACG
jgi:hypothetical protein